MSMFIPRPPPIAMPVHVLVRYGRIPEVAKVVADDRRERGERVVVRTHRGVELATVLDTLKSSPKPDDDESDFTVLREATAQDEFEFTGLATRAGDEFDDWTDRIARWKLDLQLVDLEWTLDRQKLILYVLNERGPECTRLAIQAAAEGLGIVEVQPVSSMGLSPKEKTGGEGGGCGDCGCGH
jgi:cell fate regulator YaaT (PSP1 superfamily)